MLKEVGLEALRIIIVFAEKEKSESKDTIQRLKDFSSEIERVPYDDFCEEILAQVLMKYIPEEQRQRVLNHKALLKRKARERITLN